ncbi:MAG: tRNA (5-methylaminomethyl-2-thiouridine)(34)-methyltransferase MnmD [Porphyromonadaceae bacterium]|nr:tRNA (5-methylaminomethyl-2-thiouridine)(34)-methyltransferase MnmD [Porphyromonadaceae bacterium]
MPSDKRSLTVSIEITEDGSHTLYVPELNEHYHSTHGAIQESTHIFIREGLLHRLLFQPTGGQESPELQHDLETQQQLSPEQSLQHFRAINLLEIGFGTGLNALLTLLEAEKKEINVFYQGLERFPISNETVQKLNYTALLNRFERDEAADTPMLSDQRDYNDVGLVNNTLEKKFLQLHKTPWEKAVVITPGFTLLKQQIDFSVPDTFIPDRKFDLIYYDAFAPDKQPEMWTQDIFNYLYSLSEQGAILTTYCAKGVVRRMLQTARFRVERLPGPPGKREILRASKL